MDPIPPLPAAPEAATRRFDAAVALEAAFLAEMLKSAGMHDTSGAFGGGPGAEHFASYLREAQAQKMAEAGGIGLAEHLVRAMAGRADG